VRLIGVTAADITPAVGGQLPLFADGAARRQAALNHALDRIVARFGTESIGRGGARGEKASPSLRVKPGE
jgi:hypothetical protein